MDNLVSWFDTLTNRKPPVFNVPTNHSSVLDFSPSSQTPESKASTFLLSHDNPHTTISLTGMGGSGKSTILRHLPSLQHIRTTFRDAIWFITLGQDATLSSLFAQFRPLVQALFPGWLQSFSVLAASAHEHSTLVVQLVQHLSRFRVLLIFDDVVNDGKGVYKLLSQICSEVRALRIRSFKVITSTRSQQIARSGIHDSYLDVSPAPSGLAQKILCHYAGVQTSSLDSLSHDAQQAFDEIMSCCCGLPLALCVAGSSVRSGLMREREGGLHTTSKSPWRLYSDSLGRNISRLGGSVGPEHEGLFASLRASVEGLSKTWSVPEISLEEIMRSLCVLQKQMCVPLDILGGMWRVDVSCAEVVLDVLSENNFCEWEVDELGVKGLRLHDLVHEFCYKWAVEKEGTKHWHGRIIEKYIGELSVGSKDGLRVESLTRERRAGRTGYIEDNMVRHLLEAGRWEDALRLLVDYQWIQYVNSDEHRHAFEKLIPDLMLLKEHIAKQKEDAKIKAQLVEEIDALADTMMLCMLPHCMKDRGECTSQLYGRLASLHSTSELVEHLMWSIDTYAKRPWIRPGPGVLKGARSGLKGVLNPGFNVSCFELGMGKDDLLVGGDHGELVVISRLDGREKHKLHKHDSAVVGICVNVESRRIYSCCENGLIVVWKDYCFEREFPAQFDSQDMLEVTSMVLLRKPEVFALGFSDGKIKVLDFDTGNIIKTLQAHEDEVLMFATKSERRMASSSESKIVLWDIETWKPVFEKVQDPSSPIYSIALSPDGRRIASGTNRGVVYIWDVERNTKKCAELTKSGGWVQSVLFSADGTKLYAGCFREIRVWNVEGDEISLLHKIRDHRMTKVCWLRLSEHETELFEFSHPSEYIFVWRTTGWNRESSPAEDDGSLFSASSCGVSADNQTLVTYDGTTRQVELRDANEVYEGSDIVLEAFILEHVDSSLHLISVSDDRTLVAYTLDFEIAVIHVVDMQGSPVCRLAMGENDGLSYPLRAMSMVFSEAVSLTADVFNFKTEQKVKMSWVVPSGERTEVDSTNSEASEKCAESLVCKEEISTEHTVILENGKKEACFTLERAPATSCYCSSLKRLWMWGRYEMSLQYVDLICTTFPKRPFRHFQGAFLRGATKAREREKKQYDVFISHAGTDKETIALPLYDALKSHGLCVFTDKNSLRAGQKAGDEMDAAMESAYIAIVILSPEFAARKWPMKELICFLSRAMRDDVVIIPVFYRLGISDCRSVKNVIGMVDVDGRNVFEKEGILHRIVEDGEYFQAVFAALSEVTKFTGFENFENARNVEADVGKRERLVERVVDGVVEAWKRMHS